MENAQTFSLSQYMIICNKAMLYQTDAFKKSGSHNSGKIYFLQKLAILPGLLL